MRSAGLVGLLLLLLAGTGCTGGRGYGWYVPPNCDAGTTVKIRIVNQSNATIAGTTGSGSPFSVAPGETGFVEDFFAVPPCHVELHFAEGAVCACPYPLATFHVPLPERVPAAREGRLRRPEPRNP